MDDCTDLFSFIGFFLEYNHKRFWILLKQIAIFNRIFKTTKSYDSQVHAADIPLTKLKMCVIIFDVDLVADLLSHKVNKEENMIYLF